MVLAWSRDVSQVGRRSVWVRNDVLLAEGLRDCFEVHLDGQGKLFKEIGIL